MHPTEEKASAGGGQVTCRDPYVMFQSRYYVPIAIITGFGLPVLAGWAMGSAWGGFVFGGFLRIVVTHHCTFFINSLCHILGRQPYSDTHSARDSFLMALFTYGEGYHNFHHEFQSDYRNGVRWYQWDPTKWSIGAMAMFGFAKKLRRVAPSRFSRRASFKMKKDCWRAKEFRRARLAALKLKVEHAQERLRAIHRGNQSSKPKCGNIRASASCN